jgi:hypothetical protein
MLYTVEIDFTNPAEEPAWDAWYHGNLPLMVTVPGFQTAQRFEKVGGHGFRFLAAYTLIGPEVFSSAAYEAVGGGGTASSRWKEWIDRKRNLYSGMDWVPPVSQEGRVMLTERSPRDLDAPDILFVPLKAVALHRSPEHRHITVTTAGIVERAGFASMDGVAVYKPLADQHVAAE